LQYRNLGETGMRVSEVSLGTWAFGSEIYDRHVRPEVHDLW
jgi:aryl-alcohol dehydrogenase-like predicted oxidoreductase